MNRPATQQFFFAKCRRCGTTRITEDMKRCPQCSRWLESVDQEFGVNVEPECPECYGPLFELEPTAEELMDNPDADSKWKCGWCPYVRETSSEL